MASATNSSSSFSTPNGGGAGNPVNSSPGQGPVPARGPGRSNNSFKGADSGRRQSPVDGGNRRPNPQRAWSQNTNPMGQKGPGPYSYHNGGGPNRKSTVSPRSFAGKESNTADMHAHDRLTFLFTAFIGLDTTITTKNGEKFTGILSGSSLESNDTSFVLKMARHYSPDGDSARANGVSEHASPYLGAAPDHQMVFEAMNVVSVSVPNVSAAAATAPKDQNSSTFRTDSDISTGRQPGRERELQRWDAAAEPPVDMSLESTTSSAAWDQFETNERLFGATSSYDENLYTTRIDRNDPSYKRKVAEAARIAHEITSSATDNPHMREERGQAAQNDDVGEEEERYSGVRRDETNFPPLQSGQPNKYTPPARRAPTGKPTVPGTPVDPAIISAQVARPKPVEQQTQQQQQQKTVATPTTKVTEGSKEAPAEQPKATGTQEVSNAAASGKPDTDLKTKHAPSKPGPDDAPAPAQAAPAAENANSHVGGEVLEQFRQFANSEKMKLQECRRHQASYDKTIKLNELMKFSQNFKLSTLVPKDLIPILAKDRNKQEEIVERAKREYDEKVANESKARTAETNSAEQKQASTAPAPPTGPARPDHGGPAPHAAPQADRQLYSRGRQGGYPPPVGPQAGRHMQQQQQQQHQAPFHGGRGGPGMLGHRLADIQQQRKGAGMQPVPPPLPIHEPRHQPPPAASGAVSGGDQSVAHKPVPTPTSAGPTKFNARAMEFKPNPAATSFTPAGTSAVSSSPASNARTRSMSRAASPSTFFGAKKPLPASERPSLKNRFNPIKRMKTEATEQSSKDFAFNGGIPPAYRTQPVWEVPTMNEDKTYKDMYKVHVPAASMSPQPRRTSMSQGPHHPQVPFHMQQQGHQVAPPPAGPPHVIHPQQHPPSGPPQFDDHHRMQVSASSSQAFPSPRLPQNQMAYQSPMGHQAQLAMGQPMPQYYSPQGPHPPHMRHYPQGPHFGNPQNGMGASMMVQQASSGPYMPGPQGMGAPYNPQMQQQMYSPNPPHAYPHVQQPPQPHSGYPSPSRGAPMMAHQGSQQGHPSPGMYMNPGQHPQPFYGPQQPGHMPPPRPGQQHPPFSSSPRQAHHYPHQPRNQGNNYNHGPHMPPPHMQSQGPPPAAPAALPAGNPPDNSEDVK